VNDEYYKQLFNPAFNRKITPYTYSAPKKQVVRNTIIDLRILDDHPEALAKITEALAKVYFDNVLKKDFDIKPFSEAYTKAFNLCPNYRLILQNKPGFEKYKDLNPIMGEITALPIK